MSLCQERAAEQPLIKKLDGNVTTFLWLGVMVVLWGLSWPATKLALGTVPPLWLATLRFGSAAACLFVFVALRGKLQFPPRKDWPIVASMGFLQMMAFTGLGMIAMTHTDTSRAVLLAYTTPLWAVIMSWLLFKQVPSGRQITALAVGLAGVVIICSPLELDWTTPQTIIGCSFLLMGAICWSVVILHIRRHNWAASPLSLAPWQMLIATIPLSGFAYALEGAPTAIALDRELIELLFFIGPVATSACFVISAEYGRRITAFAMSNFTLGVPLIGIISSIAVLGNRITPAFAIGLVLVLSGMLLAAKSSTDRNAI
ncbi:DMT family transporter [Ochrobactrum soli]|uniref:Permease of the drug/metabolite transporter (DMT) superfamily n=1 Tax=Ochrobactrum soli TaxID=2448455 RepID=A0A2P9HDX8_9HYPH|nr:DMT family transporter [[Ochrobactrum] soli]SPL62317.1 Permease of the drug/metabolite transporter (DMT) superfamily [[Ochrobactrum] soli]